MEFQAHGSPIKWQRGLEFHSLWQGHTFLVKRPISPLTLTSANFPKPLPFPDGPAEVSPYLH